MGFTPLCPARCAGRVSPGGAVCHVRLSRGRSRRRGARLQGAASDSWWHAVFVRAARAPCYIGAFFLTRCVPPPAGHLPLQLRPLAGQAGRACRLRAACGQPSPGRHLRCDRGPRPAGGGCRRRAAGGRGFRRGATWGRHREVLVGWQLACEARPAGCANVHFSHKLPPRAGAAKPFDGMNGIVASLLLNLTSSGTGPGLPCRLPGLGRCAWLPCHAMRWPHAHPPVLFLIPQCALRAS